MTVSRRAHAALTTRLRTASSRARALRWQVFAESFPELAGMRVLDLGGTPRFWKQAPVQPAAVTTVNLHLGGDAPSFVTEIQGDACNPPTDLMRERFDIVVSNSLIEHVGGHAQRQRLADVVHAASTLHWIQTPYRYFPIEPHWAFPGLQFLPFASRVWLTQRWPLGHRHTADNATAVASVHEVELLSISQMRSYFPGSQLWLERAAGLPKSLVAIRQ